MRIELHRQIEGTIKTLSIKKDAGNYYAIFATVQEITPPVVKNTNPVGIDVGLTTFAALSNGTKINKPNFARKGHKKIAHWQRVISKKKMGSKNRGKAKLKLQKSWLEVDNQQNDYLQQITNQLINSGYTSFAMEKLEVNNMVRNPRYARSIMGASWSRFKDMLTYKAESAGMKVIEVDPQNTTKTCNRCGNVQDMGIEDRTYLCQNCGLKIDRDINASINILNRATSGQGGSHASGDMASTYQQDMQAVSRNEEHTLRQLVAGEAHTL